MTLAVLLPTEIDQELTFTIKCEMLQITTPFMRIIYLTVTVCLLMYNIAR